MSVIAQKNRTLPRFENVAALKATTAANTPEREVFVQGTLTKDDGGDDIWYLIGGSYDAATYSDDYWHCVDASNRLWARDSDLITAVQFGITVSDTHSDAVSAGDFATEVQALVDFWIDPWARNRTRNLFPAWTERPDADQYNRPATVGPTGYIRCDTTIFVGPIDYAGGRTGRRGTSKPERLRFQASVMTPWASYQPAFYLNSPSMTMDDVDMVLACSKEIQGGQTYWNTKTYTENRQQCKYPHVPWHKNGHYLDASTLTWGTDPLYQTELISVEAAGGSHGGGLDGSRWLYLADVDGEVTSPIGGPPTHTGGTVDNLKCLGMYVTPTVGSGGQHDWFEIAAADQDIGIQITGGKDVGRRGNVVLDADNYEHQCMVRVHDQPVPTGLDGSRHTSVCYGYNVTLGNRKDCRHGLSIVTREDNALTYGLCNGNIFNFTQNFIQFDSGSPAMDNDQSVIGVLMCRDPRSENDSYESNENRFYDVAPELAPERTEPAHLIPFAIGHGKECEFSAIRNDSGSGNAMFISKQRNIGINPNGNFFSFTRTPRIYAIQGNNHFKFEHEETLLKRWQKVINFDNNIRQGSDAAIGIFENKIAFLDANGIRGTDGSVRKFLLNSWATWKASNGLYSPDSVNARPGHFFRVTRERFDRSYGLMSVHLLGGEATSTGRVFILWLAADGSVINPNRWATELIGGAAYYAAHFVGGTYQTTDHTQWSSDATGDMKFSIPPWAAYFAVSVEGTDIRGYEIAYEGTMRLDEYNLQTPNALYVERPPDVGKHYVGETIPGPSGKQWYLQPAGEDFDFTYTPTEYYAVYNQHASGIDYDAGMYVSDSSNNLWRCTSSGTSNTADDPAGDTGATWTQELTSVNIALPSDWKLN